MPFDEIVIEPARLRIADEHVILKLRGPGRIADVNRSADRGAAVRVQHRLRSKAETVVRLAEAWIIGATQQLIDRRTVTIGAVKIPAIVPAQAERIHLSVSPVSYTHLRAHETPEHLVCRLLL